jgi:ATP synthase protein I
MSKSEDDGKGSVKDGGSFDNRLRAARARQGLDAPPASTGDRFDPLSGSAWSIGLRVGVELVSALALGVAIGWALDRWLGTGPILLAVFVMLGGAAGVLNVWRLFAPRGQGSRGGGSGGGRFGT